MNTKITAGITAFATALTLSAVPATAAEANYTADQELVESLLDQMKGMHNQLQSESCNYPEHPTGNRDHYISYKEKFNEFVGFFHINSEEFEKMASDSDHPFKGIADVVVDSYMHFIAPDLSTPDTLSPDSLSWPCKNYNLLYGKYEQLTRENNPEDDNDTEGNQLSSRMDGYFKTFDGSSGGNKDGSKALGITAIIGMLIAGFGALSWVLTKLPQMGSSNV